MDQKGSLRKFLELNENKNTMYQNVCETFNEAKREFFLILISTNIRISRDLKSIK